jgi:hypothetical protein
LDLKYQKQFLIPLIIIVSSSSISLALNDVSIFNRLLPCRILEGKDK